jgi:putative transposase
MRRLWRKYQGIIDLSRLVFIDETWTKTNMAPLRGWSLLGTRLIDKVPHGHWQTMTFIAALRHDRIEAPWLLDGPINGEMFLIYVTEVLVPTLRPRDVVMMDNLGSHKNIAVRKAIRKAGATVIFLPKYSPDLNPIEQLFSKFKHELRKTRARTFEAIKTGCSSILDMFKPEECKNFLLNAGYGRI